MPVRHSYRQVLLQLFSSRSHVQEEYLVFSVFPCNKSGINTQWQIRASLNYKAGQRLVLEWLRHANSSTSQGCTCKGNTLLSLLFFDFNGAQYLLKMKPAEEQLFGWAKKAFKNFDFLIFLNIIQKFLIILNTIQRFLIFWTFWIWKISKIFEYYSKRSKWSKVFESYSK